MNIKWNVFLGVGSVVLALGASGAAHHGQAGLFDEERIVELKGTVKNWRFVNPHPVLILDVTDKGVASEWDVFFGPSAMSFLRRQGYTPETFRAGEAITVKGHPATTAGVRGIDVWGKGTSVMRADGSTIP